MARNLRKVLAAGTCAATLIISVGALAEGAGAPGAMPPPPSPPFGPLGVLPPPPVGPDLIPALSGPPPRHPDVAPRQGCLNGIAVEAGLHAYMAAKLTLTAAQESLWQRVEAAYKKGADARRQICDRLPATADTPPPTLTAAIGAERDLLTARVAELQEVQPAMSAFYEALSPEQRSVIDPPLPVRR